MIATATIQSAIAPLDLPAVLRYLAGQFPGKTVFSTSFGIEDQVLIHHIFENQPDIRVFTLDTGRIFPETYAVMNSTRTRYKKQVETFFPLHESVEKMLSEKGPSSFYESMENRKECCGIRKVEPLGRALQGAACWITGLRREQSDNRKEMPMVEWDEKFGVYKVHPLLEWSSEDIKAEIAKYNIPYNTLHDKGYVSIGCQPCTRAIRPGEDFRAGRWWWENNDKKECGLHA